MNAEIFGSKIKYRGCVAEFDVYLTAMVQAMQLIDTYGTKSTLQQ